MSSLFPDFDAPPVDDVDDDSRRGTICRHCDTDDAPQSVDEATAAGWTDVVADEFGDGWWLWVGTCPECGELIHAGELDEND